MSLLPTEFREATFRELGVSTFKAMDSGKDKFTGIERLIKRWKKRFRIPENQNYYTEKDYQEAEKKFIRYCLTHGGGQDIGEDVTSK